MQHGSGIFVQIGAGAGDLDVRANCRDGFTEFIKKLPRDQIKKSFWLNRIHLIFPCCANAGKIMKKP